MSFDEFALICTYSAITMLSQAKSGLSFFCFDFPDGLVVWSSLIHSKFTPSSISTVWFFVATARLWHMGMRALGELRGDVYVEIDEEARNLAV